MADITDAALINPWGAAESAAGPFWISNQGSNDSTLYSVTSLGVSKLGLTVTTPTTTTGPQGPTGQVRNANTSQFILSDGSAASFIFANLNGTISAWNGAAGTAAQNQPVATTSGPSTGLAIDNVTGRLYAATASGINVFNSSFAPVTLGPNAFKDPTLPAGLVPFNVQNIGGKIYVTYAPATRSGQISATAGAGTVAVFDTSGNFIAQVVSGSNLASSWGIVLAPASFGLFGGDLLVGNFSYVDSEINAFDPVTGALIGTIPIDPGATDTAGGLWSLTFGNGGTGGLANTLYFADGINGEHDGLFGAIAPVPEPADWLLMVPGLAVLAACHGARIRQR